MFINYSICFECEFYDGDGGGGVCYLNVCVFSVKQLKDVIERSCGISVDKQVLLVSGGECLDPTARVCSYSAGTDTNPIYLFSKSTIESVTPPSLSMDFGTGIV